MSSKAKLMLSIFISPKTAFKEISERNLFGTAIAISFAAGTAACAGDIVRGIISGPIDLYAIGKDNPICWLGILFLYAWLTMKLLSWIGVRADYEKIITIMGWSQVMLVLSQIVAIVYVLASASQMPNQTLVNFLGSVNLMFLFWYVLSIGYGVCVLYNVSISFGLISYLVVASIGGELFGVAYNTLRMRAFESSLPGYATAQRIIAAEQTPWLFAAVIGFIIFVLCLGSTFGWTKTKRRGAAIAVIVAGGLVSAGYIYSICRADYYHTVLVSQQMYKRGNYKESADRLSKLLVISKDNQALILDLGDAYFLAGDNAKSLDYYQKLMNGFKNAAGSSADIANAQTYSRIGAAYDMQGKYDEAIKSYEQSIKLWPQFKDPWVRMAVTYDKMGNYSKAVETGNHAVKEMDTDSVIAWVALAQAFAQTNDAKQTKAAIAMVVGKDPYLAKRIGETNDDWKNAVSKLTAQDLKFPLEKEISKQNEKSKKL